MQEPTPKSMSTSIANLYLGPGTLDVRPMFRAHLRYGALADDLMLIKSETETFVIDGIDADNLGALLALLDGKRTVRQVLRELDGLIDAAGVFWALNLLNEQGHIDTIQGDVLPDPCLWHSAGLDLNPAYDSLMISSVAIVSFGIDASIVANLCDALDRVGIDAAPSAAVPEPSFTVALVDDYLNPDLQEMNRRLLRLGAPWLIAKPVGRILWFGPVFDSLGGPCWACLAQRLRDNKRDELVAMADDTSQGLGVPSSQLYDAASLSILTTQIALLSGGATSDKIARSLKTFDHVDLSSAQHTFPHRPQCLDCGATETKIIAPLDVADLSTRPAIRIENHIKRSASDGGYRVCSSEETIARLSPFVSPVTGIIPHLKDNAIGPFRVSKCKQVTPWRALGWQRRIDLSLGAGGKGASSAQARAGCMAEAIERYSGTYQGDEPRVFGSMNKLAPLALNPNSAMGFSAQQYADHAAGKTTGFSTPKPFDAAMELDWAPLWSLRDETWRLLPTAYCYYETPPPNDFCISDSNGCAAGNVMVEAVLHSLLELIERDAIAIWWYNMLRRPPLDRASLNSFAAERISGLSQELAAQGRSFDLIDLTNDLQVPVIGAVSADKKYGDKIVFGFGAHLDPSIAAMRAASELVQLDVYCREAEDSTAPRMEQVRHWFATATLENHRYLVPDATAVPARHIEVNDDDDLKDSVDKLVRMLSERGHDVLLLDATRPDLDFPVVRMIVPGLRHYHNRFAPGRLYDVPVEMGWTRSALAEGDLNPIAYFA